VLTLVLGDKIITPNALVQVVYTARLATEEDFQKPSSPTENSTKSDAKRPDEDDLEVLLDRKNTIQGEDITPTPLVHAPYFPIVPPWLYDTSNSRNTNHDGGPSYLSHGTIAL